MSQAVLLIPGFFGFGKFGANAGTIEYFADVRRCLEAARPELEGRIVVHEPPPTGSIDERVASLHEAVRRLLEGKPLRHNAPVRADRVHLVGHSAGGVDARLYANAGFVWMGGPRERERREPLEAIGHVVTLSSPHAGTPIATNAVHERDGLLFAIHALTLLGATRCPPTAATLLALGELARRAPRGGPSAALLGFAAGLDAATLAEIDRFFSLLVEDRQLMGNLTPPSMAFRTQGLRTTDHPRLHCYVSVSPRPKWGLDSPVQRLLYARAYAATAEGDVGGNAPRGPVLGGDAAARLAETNPSDGVVPAASQTIDGTAAGIVEGDHLDVVGHFTGGPSGSVFRSDAGFDASRFEALWNHVADVLTRAPLG